jgi:hypothetical protein
MKLNNGMALFSSSLVASEWAIPRGEGRGDLSTTNINGTSLINVTDIPCL